MSDCKYVLEDAALVKLLDAARSSTIHHRDRLRELRADLEELVELRGTPRMSAALQSLREADALLSATADDIRSMRRIDARRVS